MEGGLPLRILYEKLEKQLEDMTVSCYYGTNCFLHISSIRELAENGFYHLEGKK